MASDFPHNKKGKTQLFLHLYEQLQEDGFLFFPFLLFCCIYGLLNSRQQHRMDLLRFLDLQLYILCSELQQALSAFYKHMQELRRWLRRLDIWPFKVCLHLNLVRQIIIWTFGLTPKLFKRKTLIKVFEYAESHCNFVFRQQDCKFKQWTFWLN